MGPAPLVSPDSQAGPALAGRAHLEIAGVDAVHVGGHVALAEDVLALV